METPRRVLIFVTALTTASCFPLINGSAIAINSGEFLTVTPARTQVKAVGSKLIFTCTLVRPQLPDTTTTTGTPLTQLVFMQWKGPDSNYVTSQKGRLYTERVDERRLRLYITEVEERDSGSYSCEANINGALLVAHSHLNLFDDIRFLNGSPALVRHRIGTSVLLECSAYGKPEPEISWRFRGRKLVSERTSEKYVYEKSGLRINHLTKDDNGTYECRAQVPSQGNLKVRHISLEVMYPPEWIVPPRSPVAIRGNDVTLECLAEGNPPVKYQWFKEILTSNGVVEEPLRNDVDDDGYNDDEDDEKDGDDIDHYGTEAFLIKRVEMTDQGRYVCRASNGLGSIDAFYDVNVLVVPVVTAPKQPSVLEGKTIVLPCEAAGIPAPTVNWKRKNEDNEELNLVDGVDDIHVNVSEGGIARLWIRNADRKRHSGKYTCVANNSAGFDSKDIEVVVETLPEARLSHVELVGWRGESRQVTCLATGLPLPTIVWLHDGKYVSSSNHHVQVTTIRDAENVTSIIEIKLEDDFDYLFGNYSCVAKNIHDHVTREFQLRRAYPPEAPRNITVIDETAHSISLSASASSSGPGTPFLPPTTWILKYQRTSNSSKPETTINLLYEEGTSIVVGNLDADTAYTMYLSVANAAGIGPSVKFQAKTTSEDLAPKYPVNDDESGDFQADDGGRAVDASLQRDAVALNEKDLLLERTLLSDWGGISIGLVIGIAVMLAVVVVTVSGAIVRTQRAGTVRRAVMTVVKEGGAGGGTTIKVSECKDIDSLKVETNRPKTSVGPIPGDRYGSLGSRKNIRVKEGSVGVGASPVMARAGVASPGVVRAAGVAPVDGSNSAQSQAWQNMLLKAEAEARDEALLKELEAQGVVDELPHPPLELLLRKEADGEAEGAEEDGDGQQEEEVDEEDEVFGDDDASRMKDDGLSEEDGMSLNSDDDAGFPKAPQFEGKSFLQY